MVALAGAAVAAVGSVASGVIGAGASSAAATKARRAQETAATQQLEWNRHMWSQEQVDRAPWITQGRDALGELRYQADFQRDNPTTWSQHGVVDPGQYRYPGADVPDPSQYRYTAPGVPDPNQYRFNPQQYQFRGQPPVDPSGYRFDPGQYGYTPRQALDASQYRYTPTDTAPLGQFDFKPPTLTDDPGYQFRLRQGQEALDASASARGGLGSGAQLKALQAFGQELGSQEYGAAYGRSWQQQQEEYDRRRLANMTQEERQRYADATRYGRDWQSDVTQEERDRYANAASYERGLTGNQLDWARANEAQKLGFDQGLAGSRFNADLALQGDEANWNRALGAQQEQFRQGSYGAEQDWARNWQAQQEQYNRGLTTANTDWQRAVYGNETANARAWQEYAATIAEQERGWNRWSTLAGYGQNQQNTLGTLGANYANQINSAYAGMGNAGAAGAIAQGNAWTGGLSTAMGGVNSAMNNYMAWKSFQNQDNASRMGYNAAGQRTSGTLPTTMAQYNRGLAQGLYNG